MVQNEQTRSNNKSSSFGIGAYAATNPGKGASAGITLNASGAKGHANSDATTYANSHINVGGTTTLDIGNDVNIKGGVLTTDTLTGQVAGDLNTESLQDTYQYDSKQKNAGFSADIDLATGAGSNLSVNGGKTNLDADYAAVTEQTAIYTQKADLKVGGKGNFKGAAFTTATIDDNKTIFDQGIKTSDIQSHSNYDGKAISVGVSLGQSNGKASANMQGIGYGTDSDSQTSTTKASVTGMAGQADVTTATKDSLNKPLVNSFDASTVNEELGAQVDITRAFGVEAPKAVAEFSKERINDIKADPNLSIDEKLAEIAKWDEGGVYRVAAHTAIGALGAGSLEGTVATGSVAAAAPKINEYENKLADALVSSGMSPEAANATSKGVTTLTLAGIGATTGLDTSSTATAINVDSNNRQLHPEKGEYWAVDQLYQKQGSKKKWSREQIANALRSADFKKARFKEDDESNTVVNLSNGEPDNYIDFKNGAAWKYTGGGIRLPVDRNVDPILAAWINQVLNTDGDFKSYKYTWDAQNLKGNKPLPKILTLNETSSNTSSNTAPKPKSTNPAQQYTDRDLKNRNSAVVNNNSSIDSGRLTAYEQQQNQETFNNLVTVVETASLVTGAGEVVIGVKVAGKGIVHYIVKKQALKEAKQGDIPVDDLVGRGRNVSDDVVEKARIDNNFNHDNDFLTNKPSGRQEYNPKLENLKKQISPTIAQSQRKHIKGDSQHQHGSYFNNKDEAQEVLDAFHNNKATIVGYNRQNQPIVRYDNGKGTYATNQNGEIKTYKTVYYLIKGTKKVSIVPYSPRGPK